MDDFLTKPVAFEALRATLGKYLSAAPALLAPTQANRSSAVDAQRLSMLVAELTPLLEQQKFDALACVKALQSLVAGSDLAPPFEEIDTLVREFKFTAALERLRATVTEQKY
jgi:hypothetical protein